MADASRWPSSSYCHTSSGTCAELVRVRGLFYVRSAICLARLVREFCRAVGGGPKPASMAFTKPLYLPVEKEETPESSSPSDSILQCFVCDKSFTDTPVFLKHLLEDHSLVIEDANTIADLPAYCK